ncbi:MAG: AzlC family ABC transporter permease [Clostridia bacterium]|nr:AzlC family ABC transporter permease [Clostridia bacterium]MBQ4608223.1 AzlC family ABC transporter permease [Clostridia bacterium]
MGASERLKALRLTVPVMCGYLFLGTAFGATLAQAGFGPAWALMMSGLVYAGSLQFVMVPLMASGAGLVSVALTALMVNARHLFYGVSYIERFARMGMLRPYMVFSLTDETYSVFCGLPQEESDGVMLRVAAYDHLYWVAGSVAGSLLARQLPFDLTGIDFSMTALFIVICVERAMNRADRLPLMIGAVCASGCLLLLGPDNFLAPALALTATLLLFIGGKEAAR